MYETTNRQMMQAEVESCLRQRDRINARYPAGTIRPEGVRDAVTAAGTTVSRYIPWILELADSAGEDFLEFNVGDYSLCYSHENDRWEAFITVHPAENVC
jgi:hypothetical protein